MSEEEKEALEILEALGIKCDGIDVYKTIKNLIEKQQKENKNLELCLKAEENYSKGLNEDIKSLLNIEPNNKFIHKDKIKAIQGQLCMQLGSYVQNKASPKQERIAGGINIINKILKGE